MTIIIIQFVSLNNADVFDKDFNRSGSDLFVTWIAVIIIISLITTCIICFCILIIVWIIANSAERALQSTNLSLKPTSKAGVIYRTSQPTPIAYPSSGQQQQPVSTSVPVFVAIPQSSQQQQPMPTPAPEAVVIPQSGQQI
ncbi:uncharacterized protein LOC128953950 [Oppia nitens]|uniref:uncharacterized protein LOC128953950 n=1 Tax=Oppia nitens TaxID=1686743 RepID=UPI0023DC0FCA|nr:uncharacterized protein LOC128953950 [Oppia nitens]